MSLNFELTVFSDPQGEAAAKVYVVAVPTRDASANELAAYRLSGNIIGPTCRYSSTLQSKIPFKHRGFTQCGYRTALVAEAMVPDPCYWSAELPFLYRAAGEVNGDITGATSFDQTFGIRSIGTSRRRLTFNGKVWVPRCVAAKCISHAPLSEWRVSDTAMYVETVADVMGQAASEAGIVLVTKVDALDEHAEETLFQLSRFPAVAIVSMGRTGPIDRRLQTANRNTLLGHDEDGRPLEEDDATNFRLVRIGTGGMAMQMKSAMDSGLPLLAFRPIAEGGTLTEARAECDRTQREMAQIGESAAGYIVI